ncbi:hypothetical protein D9M72_439990 [compost metagenome]
MFGRLDDVGAHALDAAELALHMLRHDGLQHACAHFDGLLHEIVEPADLQRREKIDKIARFGLRARLLDSGQHQLLLAGEGEFRTPLAVTSVEDEDRGAFLIAKNVDQVVELLLGRLVGGARIEGMFDEQSLHAKIGAHIGAFT